MMEGRVVRCINTSENCDTDNYCGLIQMIDKNQSNNATLFTSQHEHPLHNTTTTFLLSDFNDDDDKHTSLKQSPLTKGGDNIERGQQGQCYRDQGTFYSFRICSLIDRRDVPCMGELVRFQPIDNDLLNNKHLHPQNLNLDNYKFIKAGMVVSMKRCLHTRVESVNTKVLVTSSLLPYLFFIYRSYLSYTNKTLKNHLYLKKIEVHCNF